MFVSKLLLMIGIIIGLIYLFNLLLSKLLRMGRRKIFFSYVYVSPLHRKIDWIVRIIMGCTMFYFIVKMSINESILFHNVLLIIALLAVIPDIVRCIFEWTHKQRKDAVITISNCGLFFLIVFVVLQFEIYKFFV
ncbi:MULTISPECIES: DUF4181 domain-containing protein [Bacillus]|uniref:DUF4181 domain-containing protein n=1 Tax=Bacillus TaxID=1386 RepID=UPI000BB7EC0C|nr:MULTISPECIES: DUF4181 domain-containing protein [Bacillus]